MSGNADLVIERGKYKQERDLMFTCGIQALSVLVHAKIILEIPNYHENARSKQLVKESIQLAIDTLNSGLRGTCDE